MRGGTMTVYARVLVSIRKGIAVVYLTNFASEAKVANPTDAHLVYKNILEFDIPVYISCDLVQVTYALYNLSKHPAYFIVRQ